MKILTIATLLSFAFVCNGDVSESRNHRLPFNSLARIPSPTQSLLPPTFENPIKDYTVGLVPPPVDNQAVPELRRRPVHASVSRQPTHRSTGFITSSVPSRLIVKSPRVSSLRNTVHHQIHHSTNLVQPQVYQPKTVVYQQPNQFGTRYAAAAAPLAIRPQTLRSTLSNPVQYFGSAIGSAVHQQSPEVHYSSVPVHKAPTLVEHVRSSVLQSHPVPLSGVKIIQSYPLASYAATVPQHGSTLNLRNYKLEPELVEIISTVLDQYDF